MCEVGGADSIIPKGQTWTWSKSSRKKMIIKNKKAGEKDNDLERNSNL